MKKNAVSNNVSSNVTINAGKLILSLPDAKSPTIWQVNIDAAQLSAFSIKEDSKKKTFSLVSQDSSESINEIAAFDDKQEAVDILMEISNVLQTTQSKNKSNPSNDNKTGSDNKIGAVISVALIVVLIIIWTQTSSKKSGLGTQGSASVSSSSSVNASESSGVPMSADDFLNNR